MSRNSNSTQSPEKSNNSPPAYSDEQRRKLRDKGGKYFIFREDFLDITTLEGAVVLQKLLNVSRWRMQKKEGTYDGWFLYTVDFFKKQLRVDQKVQLRLLNLLEKQGFIRFEYRGIPPRRYIWIDVDAIDRALDKEEKQSDPEPEPPAEATTHKRGPYKTKPSAMNQTKPSATSRNESSNEDSKEEQTLPPAARDGRACPKSPLDDNVTNCHSRPGVLARKLYEGLLKLRLVISARRTRLSDWSEEFSKALRDRTYEELDSAIDFHLAHIHDKYHPQLYSAKSFCADLPRVERAMRVESGQVNTKKTARELEEERIEKNIW